MKNEGTNNVWSAEKKIDGLSVVLRSVHDILALDSFCFCSSQEIVVSQVLETLKQFHWVNGPGCQEGEIICLLRASGGTVVIY